MTAYEEIALKMAGLFDAARLLTNHHGVSITFHGFTPGWGAVGFRDIDTLDIGEKQFHISLMRSALMKARSAISSVVITGDLKDGIYKGTPAAFGYDDCDRVV